MANQIIEFYESPYWHLNDQLHREDGPAVIYPCGSQHWFISGKRHRTNGPAIIRDDGTIEWYLNGVKYTFNDYCDTLNLTNEDILLLKIQYG